MKKRILSFALALCFVFTLIPTAFADLAPTSGECGDSLTWTLDSNGTLTISGTGEMENYDFIYDNGSLKTSAPWGGCYSSIKSVVINDGVTSIGNFAFYAFYGCSSLTSVTIPDSVTYIGDGAFSGCSSLTSITVDKGNEYYCSDNGVLFSKDGYYEDGKGFCGVITELHTYPTGKSAASYIIPDSVASLSMTRIRSDAFSGCSSLKSVTIPDSVTDIGSSAFCGCSSLTSITIPASVTSICTGVFDGCSSLKSVTIPDSVTDIGDGAFSGCSSLTSVTIPDSVTGIGWGTFYGCSSLTSVTIPDSVTSIEYYVFYGCSSLTSITVDNNNKYFCSDNGVLFNKDKTELHTYPAGKSNTSYTIPKSVTSIGEIAFDGCSSLKSVMIPDSVTDIGDGAFSGCSSLTSITVDKGNEYYCSDNGVLFSKDYERYYEDGKYVDKGIMELHTYPAGKSAASYIIPGRVAGLSVTSIGGWAFSDCSSLTSVTIPDSVTSIGDSAFHGCSSLTSITIPASVTSIGDYAFFDCTNLTSITIPASVTSIGDSVFCWCDSLTDVYYGGNAAQWKAISIGDDNYPLFDATIHYAGEPAAPAAPVIKITTSAGKPKISWSKVDGAVKYQVYRSTDGKKYSLLATTTGTSITNTKAKIGTKYYYKVKAVNSGGAMSEFSNGVSIKCRPAAPTVSISRSNGKPKLTWKAVTGADKYYIYRSTDGKNYKQYTSTTKTSYTNTRTTIGTTYYYKVKAAKVVNGKNVYSVYSNVKSVKCVPAAPVVSISRSNGKPKLTWKAVTGADKYYIYRSTDGKTYKQYTSTTKTSYTNTGAASGKKYYYKVKAVAVVNKKNVFSAYSAAKNMMTTIATPSVSITTANGKPKLTWKAVTGADKYYVYRSTNGKNYTLLVKTTKTSVTNTGAKKGTKYYYKVKAICSANTNANSAYSAVVSIKATK